MGQLLTQTPELCILAIISSELWDPGRQGYRQNSGGIHGSLDTRKGLRPTRYCRAEGSWASDTPLVRKFARSFREGLYQPPLYSLWLSSSSPGKCSRSLRQPTRCDSEHCMTVVIGVYTEDVECHTPSNDRSRGSWRTGYQWTCPAIWKQACQHVMPERFDVLPFSVGIGVSSKVEIVDSDTRTLVAHRQAPRLCGPRRKTARVYCFVEQGQQY